MFCFFFPRHHFCWNMSDVYQNNVQYWWHLVDCAPLETGHEIATIMREPVYKKYYFLASIRLLLIAKKKTHVPFNTAMLIIAMLKYSLYWYAMYLICNREPIHSTQSIIKSHVLVDEVRLASAYTRGFLICPLNLNTCSAATFKCNS